MNRLAVGNQRQAQTDIGIKAISVHSDKPFLADRGRSVAADHASDGLENVDGLAALELNDRMITMG
jgi:hypothetical protein